MSLMKASLSVLYSFETASRFKLKRRNYRFGECLTAGAGDNGQICRFTIGHGILVFNNLGLSYSTLLLYFQVGKQKFTGQSASEKTVFSLSDLSNAFHFFFSEAGHFTNFGNSYSF